MKQLSEFDFHSEDIDFILQDKPAIISWLSLCIEKEGKVPNEVSYVFCSDDFLHDMNIKHLKHNTLTDIITFDYCEEDDIIGEMFISVDRIKDNSGKFKINFNHELHRVMVHGLLHLCGYKDKTAADQKVMSGKEDFYLNLRNF